MSLRKFGFFKFHIVTGHGGHHVVPQYAIGCNIWVGFMGGHPVVPEYFIPFSVQYGRANIQIGIANIQIGIANIHIGIFRKQHFPQGQLPEPTARESFNFSVSE